MSKHSLKHFAVRVADEEEIYAEGDPGSTMFVVQSGEVQLYSVVDGEECNLGTMEKGDFFGEMSILEGVPRTTSARAASDTELLEINGATFDKMIKGNIEIAVRLLRKLSLRLRDAERKNAELLASGGAVARLAAPEAKPAAAVHESLSTRAAAASPRLEGTGGRTFIIPDTDCLIGRFDPVTEYAPDVDLTELDLKRSVSRRHARIVLSSDTYELVEEIGALNGTFINGARLVTGEARPLANGDRVDLGTVQMLFRC